MTVLNNRETKYELLTDKKRPINKYKYVAVLIGILCLIVTFLGIYYFEREQAYDNVNKKAPNVGNEQSVYTGITYMKHREKLYGEAYKEMHEEYSSNFTFSNHTSSLQENYEVNWEPMKLVCYYNFPSGDDLKPEMIDPYLCTHINIGILTIKNMTVPIPEDYKEVIGKVMELKSVNPNLKVLLCIGGMDDKGEGFSVMVNSSSSRRKFIRELLVMLSSFYFDGVDFDWEFPSWKGDETERYNFIKFLKELRKEINERKLAFIISAAVGAPATIIDVSYDVPEMANLGGCFCGSVIGGGGCLILERDTIEFHFLNKMKQTGF